MTPEQKKLDDYTDRIARLQTEKKEKDDEINELVAEASEKCGLYKNTVKSLAKDKRMNEVERANRQLQEEELDQCRVALGLLADLPLGEAAQETVSKGQKKRTAVQAEAH